MAVKAPPPPIYWDQCPSLYFQDKLEHLIQFPIPKYKLPKHYSEKVELEPIPSLPLPPYKPFILPVPLTKSNQMIVIGYREIYKKRLRIQFLRAEVGLPEDPLESTLTKQSSQLSNLNMLLAPGGGRGTGPKSPKIKGVASNTTSTSTTSTRVKKKNKKTRPPIKSKYKAMHAKYNFTKKASVVDTKALWEKRKEMMKNYGRIKAAKNAKSKKPQQQRKHMTKPPVLRQREHYRLDDEIAHEDAEKLEEELDQELQQGDAENKVVTMSIDPNLIEKPVLEQEFLRQPAPEIEEDERHMIFKPKKPEDSDEEYSDEEGALVPKKLGTPDEMDNEWLFLSDTDSLERQDRKEADRLYKQKPPWMIHGISYESQHFTEQLKWYLLSAKMMGRSPYFARPNHKQKIMEIVLHRRKEFVFFITSVILWLGFVLFFQAFIDILMLSGEDEYSVKETNEVDKYFVFIVFIAGQLGVVAIWGILLLLNYGLRLAHYINIWSVSLTEMETNAGRDIVRVTVYHHVVFLIYSLVVIISFATEYPKNIKGCMGTITALFIRNFVPKVLDSEDKGYIDMLRILGVALHLYVIYCVHITYNIIHILCLVLRNASEMWNLKFALRFGQIPVAGSGYMRQLRVRGTVTKLWLHHRLLNGLCSQLGDVFAMPLMLMFLVQLGIVTWCAVALFRSAYQTDKARQDEHDQKTWFTHSKHFHPTRLEDAMSIMMVMGYMVYEFVITATYLSGAGMAFRDGFEFVRRKGLILCHTSHERRLVQSLQWSFSATDAQKVSLLGYFNVTRETMLSFLTIALLLWSLIIQLKEENKAVIVVFTPNCSVEPKGWANGTGPNAWDNKDAQGFCRKKIWVEKSELQDRVQDIIGKTLKDDLGNLGKSRRRREIRNRPGTGHWLQGRKYVHPEYLDGDCLRPLMNLSGWERLEKHFLHFHEPCHSKVLNLTMMVPRLFKAGKYVWLGRSSVDCGLVPFPFRRDLYNLDCSGSDEGLYDDCGWRKSPVDEWVWNSRKNKESFRKIKFQLKNGREVECWNIYSALQRCRRIQELGEDAVCNTPAYEEQKIFLNQRLNERSNK